MATAPKPPQSPPPSESESFKVEYEQEEGGRWLADIPELPGVMAYGPTKGDAEVAAVALALRVLADRTEQRKKPPRSIQFL
ncbi:MAG: type II toxin-antitoxin system HicB family antitoxin [Terriglobales bacterium]|jgi:predicted RNase H-like HicB family nuclease